MVEFSHLSWCCCLGRGGKEPRLAWGWARGFEGEGGKGVVARATSGKGGHHDVHSGHWVTWGQGRGHMSSQPVSPTGISTLLRTEGSLCSPPCGLCLTGRDSSVPFPMK